MPAVHGTKIVKVDGGARRCSDGVDERSGVGAIGAEIHQPFDAQREKPTLAIERQLTDQIGGPPVMIAGDCFRPRAEPLHRLARPLGGEHDGQEFGIDLVPDAEAAAHIGRADAKFLRRQPHDVGQRRLHIGGALSRNAQLERIVGRVVDRDAGLGLHRIAGNPLSVELDPNDVRGLPEACRGALAVAVFVVEREIVGHLVMQRDGAVGNGVTRLDHDRQVLVFDRNELGRVLRNMLCIRNHQHHRLAHEPDAPLREAGPERNAQRVPAHAFEEGGRRRAFPSGGSEIRTGQDVQDAGYPSGLLDVDPRDLGVRPVGAEKVSRDLSAEFMVGCVAAPARDQTKVFPAPSELMFGQILFPMNARRSQPGP